MLKFHELGWARVLDLPVDRNPRRALITALLVLGGLLILTAGTIPWDIQVSSKAFSSRVPGDIRRLVQFAEVFAHSAGCTVILGTLLWIDVPNRKKLLQATLFIALCAIVSNAAKYVIPRSRPYTYDELLPSSSWETFGSPLTESWFDEAIRSFPSGHSATAVAMAIGLSFVYPRGKVLFFAMAALAAAQRLFSGAHFLSDIFAGITISFFLAAGWIWLARNRGAAAIPMEASSESATNSAAKGPV